MAMDYYLLSNCSSINCYLSIFVLIILISVNTLQYLVINTKIHNWSTLNIYHSNCCLAKQWHSFTECQIHGIPGIKTHVLLKRLLVYQYCVHSDKKQSFYRLTTRTTVKVFFVKCSQTLDNFLFFPMTLSCNYFPSV